MTIGQLAEVVLAATRRSLTSTQAGERLVGYALCTDDDLRSLSGVACTREFLADHNPDWLFSPTEWPDGDDDGCFAEARRMLSAGADMGLSRHVEQSFGSLVAALKGLRSDGLVADDVFLVALSTDPGELLTALEDAAVRELNPADIHRRWRLAID